MVLMHKEQRKKNSDVNVCFIFDSYDNNSRFDIRVHLLGMSLKYMDLYIQTMAFEVSDMYNDYPFVNEILRTGIEIS
jgi:hypothetical protein